MCKSLYFHKVAELTLAQVFSCEFCGISENTSGGCFCCFRKSKLLLATNRGIYLTISVDISKTHVPLSLRVP